MKAKIAKPLRVFIGYDPSEEAAFNVLAYSIWKHASEPVLISPVRLGQLGDSYWREKHPLQSTEFSISRFLVPHLCGYEGWALFMDCDMMVTDDIVKVFRMADPTFSVMCTKHEIEHKTGTKMLGQTQTMYPKKNWSSFMLFNCDKCQVLTPEFVNSVEPLVLHRFGWLTGDYQIGSIPLQWNFLVGVQDVPEMYVPSNIHWTLGGPWWEKYREAEFSNMWNDYKGMMVGEV